jgi:hypothetical protein
VQPLEGARVLVLSADPFAVEPLVAELEEADADVVFRVELTNLPPPGSIDAVVIDHSASAFEPQALWPYLESLPEAVLVLDSVQGARDALAAHLSGAAPVEEPAPPAVQPPPSWRDSRLTRAALTVTAVTALLWLVSRWQAASTGDLPPVTPADARTGGRSELAGRVTRSTTGEGLAGASVIVNGPSGVLPPTLTDGQGRWRFTGLPAGRYVVVTTARGYVANQQQVDVPEGRAVENVNFSLDPEAP